METKIINAASAAIMKVLHNIPHVSTHNVSRAVTAGAMASGVDTSATQAAIVEAINAFLSGIAPDIAAITSVSRSSWLGSIGWYCNGNATAYGLILGAFLGGIALTLLIKHARRQILGPGFLSGIIAQTKRLEIENKQLREEIKALCLQQTRIQGKTQLEYRSIEPLEDTPDKYICPINRLIINDPVRVSDGHHYERVAITEWYKRSSKKTSPLIPSRVLLNPVFLDTDKVMQAEIRNYIERNYQENSNSNTSLIPVSTNGY